MTQTHYDQANQPQISDVLLALYETVYAPERFMAFLALLESALSQEAPEHVFDAMERPSEYVLQQLITEERKALTQAEPWASASDPAALEDLLVAKGFSPFSEDIGFLSKSQDTEASIVRLSSAADDIDWIIVARGPNALEAYRMPQHWEGFLRDRLKSQFTLTDAELDVLVEFARGVGLRTIAQNRGSSYNTVRNQIRSTMDKLSVSSQSELTSAVTRVAALAPGQASNINHSPDPDTAITQMRQLSDGRAQEFNLYNAAGHTTLVLFHCLAGGKHLSDETVTWAASERFRLLCPSRAGFARSDSCKQSGTDLLQTHVQDTAELVQAVGAPGPVTAVCFGTGFASALSYAMAYPQRCRDLIAINPVPPLSAIGKASNLKGSFKVGFMAAKYAPISFKALPYFHARMHRATRETRTSPTVLPGYDLKVLETTSGYAAFKRNADDALLNGPDAIWSEASLCLSDWLPRKIGQNSLPRVVWVETADSPFTENGAFEEFRKAIGADLVEIDSTFPLFASQLPAAFAALRRGV